MEKECTLNGKKFTIRGWRVKDKLDLDRALTIEDKRKIIVYNCIVDDNDIAFDIDEYNYVLALIRDCSMKSKIVHNIECPHCGANFTSELPMLDIVSFKEADMSDIGPFKLKHISDRNDYESKINSTITNAEKYITDFALHIKSINMSDVSFDETMNYIENMDVELFEKYISEWDKQKSKCSYNKTIKCPECGKVELYNLEDMQNFFPESWRV